MLLLAVANQSGNDNNIITGRTLHQHHLVAADAIRIRELDLFLQAKQICLKKNEITFPRAVQNLAPHNCACTLDYPSNTCKILCDTFCMCARRDQ